MFGARVWFAASVLGSVQSPVQLRRVQWVQQAFNPLTEKPVVRVCPRRNILQKARKYRYLPKSLYLHLITETHAGSNTCPNLRGLAYLLLWEVFCPKCGNDTVVRVPIIVDQDHLGDERRASGRCVPVRSVRLECNASFLPQLRHSCSLPQGSVF